MTLANSGANRDSSRDYLSVNPVFVDEPVRVPRHSLPPGSLEPGVAYQIVHDELMLDGNARLNLATFVTTWMEPTATALMAECFDKNMIDKDEYPRTAALEERCVRMLAELWHAPDPATAIGCSTTGSSEACMLAGLAMKRRWQHRRRAEGRSTDRPNIVMGANVQICWEKFANYRDVEARVVPMAGDRFHLDAVRTVEYCDARARRRCVRGDDRAVLRSGAGVGLPARTSGVDQHVGHKYGLVYPGVGWVVWRDTNALPADLVFHVNYLGGDMPTFALNFSRPGAQVVAQYYTFLCLGFDGYRRVQQYCRDVATGLARRTVADLVRQENRCAARKPARSRTAPDKRARTSRQSARQVSPVGAHHTPDHADDVAPPR